MRHLFAAPIIATALLASCAQPPPPELIANTVAWAQYLCGFYPTADQIVEILDDAGRLADTRAIAGLICETFAPETP